MPVLAMWCLLTTCDVAADLPYGRTPLKRLDQSCSMRELAPPFAAFFCFDGKVLDVSSMEGNRKHTDLIYASYVD